ncbi:MAG TPA: hypothetical protein EYQ63_28975, partial [Fuerstia sp.]|nr:hypothetical protein [Fuerstiella sp.]
MAVDNITLAASNQSIRYGSSQNLGSFFRTVWDQNNNSLSFTFPTLTLATGGTGLPFTPKFKTPVELNAIDPQRMIIQGARGIFESLNQGNTISEVGGLSFSGFLQDAVAYGGFQNGTPNPDVFYVGVGDDVKVRTAAGGAVAITDPAPTDSSDIRDVAMNSNDWANAFAIDSNQVFETTNAGGLWNDVTGNLLSLAGDLRSLAYMATATFDALVVGTNAGVFASLTTSLGNWFQLGAGIPNVLAFDIQYDAVDDVLVAGTLGRGAWTLPSASDVLPTTPDVFITDVTVTEGAGTATFNVSLLTPAPDDIVLTLTTNDGTAVATEDFIATTGQVTILTGTTTATGTFDVPILNDSAPELRETFTVSVQSVDSGSVGAVNNVGVGTIIDNDAE